MVRGLIYLSLHAGACFTNPSVFVVAAFDPDFWDKQIWKVLTALSFIITTIGFVGVGIALIQYALQN